TAALIFGYLTGYRFDPSRAVAAPVSSASAVEAVQDGPGGTGFKLSRDSLRSPWRIVDSGSL
ncbi:MAG: hypothetical protein ACRYG2_32795, partial [Janthinobacterium lividum]